TDCVVEDNEIYENAKTGILGTGAKCNFTIRGGKVHDNADSGIHVQEKATVTVENCEIYANSSSDLDTALSITLGATAVIRGFKVHHNAHIGIHIHHKATGTIEDCESYKNGNTGLAAQLEGSSAVARRNKLYENGANGACAGDGGKLTLEDN